MRRHMTVKPLQRQSIAKISKISRPRRAKTADADFEAYLDGFSPNVQDILTNFEFRNQIPRLSKADALSQLIEKFLDKDINLSPQPVGEMPGLDNHSMGTLFEELVRRFNEDNNEEAGEHWTPVTRCA